MRRWITVIRNWLIDWCTPSDRYIFRFHDGVRWRLADPIAVSIALDNVPNFHPCETPRLLATADDPRHMLQLTEQIADAVREAFGLPDFDNGGLTHLECLELLAAFDDFQNGLKKSINPSPILPPPTELKGSDFIDVDDSLLKSNADSTSTVSGSLNAKVGPLPGVSKPL